MESLKPLLLLVVLAGVGYGVYVALNRAPPLEAPPGVAPDWNKPVTVVPRGNADTERNTSDKAIGAEKSMSGRLSAPSLGSEKSPDPALPWNNSVPASTKRDESLPGSGAASSLPFRIGSASIRSAAAAPSTVDGSAAAANSTQPESTVSAQSRFEYESSRRSVQKLLAEGKLVDALRELSHWYASTAVPPQDQAVITDLLGQLAGTVIYSRQHWLAPAHVVRPGESLDTIAAQYQVPWQLLAKINGIEPPYMVFAGEELKVVRGPFHANLDLGQQWLTLFVDDLYAGRYRVQISGPVNKPDGDYPLVKFGENQSGSPGATGRHISLGGDLQLVVPDDAGATSSSNGNGLRNVCIGARDMDDVYDMLSERSQVTIRR